MTDLETKLREKIEKQLEERRQARLQGDNGSTPASEDDAVGKKVEETLNARIQQNRAASAPEPVADTVAASSSASVPAIEVPPEEPSQPLEQPDAEPTTSVPEIDEMNVEITEPTTAEDLPQKAEDAEAPVVVPVVDAEPDVEVAEGDETPVVQESKDEPLATSVDDAAKVDAESPAVPTAAAAESGEESTEVSSKTADQKGATPPPPPPPPADEKAAADNKPKKKTGVGAKAPAAEGQTGKKKRTQTGRKTRMGTKAKMPKRGGTRGPSASRTLSEQEQKLLEEKSRIDEKFKKQKIIAYIAITGGTILLLIAMIVTLQVIKGKKSRKQEVVRQAPPQAPQPKAPVQDPAFASLDEMKQAVNRTLNLEKNPGAAVKTIIAYAESNPADADECETMVESIAKNYLDSGKASLLWKNMQTELTLGLTSTNPEDVVKSIAALRRFAYQSSREAFLADYMIQKLEKRYATMTGGLLP